MAENQYYGFMESHFIFFLLKIQEDHISKLSFLLGQGYVINLSNWDVNEIDKFKF